MPEPSVNFPVGSLTARLARGEPVGLVAEVSAERPAPPPSNGGPQFFAAGDFRTEGGQVIPGMQVCYETWGRPNQFSSNGVLLCHGSGGDRLRMAAYIGPGKPFDTDRFFVVAVDAIGSGLSSRPSATGLGRRFPRVTIRDMVRAQCLLLTHGLGMTGLRCVAGPSMGGYQAIEWAVTYPAFVRSAACIIGSPQRTAHQAAIGAAIHAAIAADPRWNGGDYTQLPVDGLRAAGVVWFPWIFGEEWYLQYGPETLEQALEENRQRAESMDPWDTLCQEGACNTHDVSAPYGGSLAAALGRAHMPVLVMPCATDLLVPPRHSRLMAGLLPNATYVEIPSYAGHGVMSREVEYISHQLQAFLA
jgi:homoserine O-acetyltransferase